jgi:hypothetical protein
MVYEYFFCPLCKDFRVTNNRLHHLSLTRLPPTHLTCHLVSEVLTQYVSISHQ